MCGVGRGTLAVEMNPVHLPLLSSLSSNNTTITQQISLQTLSLRQRLLYSFLFNIPLRIIICFYRALPRNEDNKTCFYCPNTCGSSSCEWILIKPDPAQDRTRQKHQRTRVLGSRYLRCSGWPEARTSASRAILYFSLRPLSGHTESSPCVRPWFVVEQPQARLNLCMLVFPVPKTPRKTFTVRTPISLSLNNKISQAFCAGVGIQGPSQAQGVYSGLAWVCEVLHEFCVDSVGRLWKAPHCCVLLVPCWGEYGRYHMDLCVGGLVLRCWHSHRRW